MSNSETLLINGFPVDLATNPISLQQGWNTIAYLPQIPGLTYTVLASIISSIIIMKDGSGNVFWPAFAVDLIGVLSPGNGYQMNMSVSQEYFFPI